MTTSNLNTQIFSLLQEPKVDISGLKAPIDTILNEDPELSQNADSGNNGSTNTQEIEQVPQLISREEKIKCNIMITKLRKYNFLLI